MELENLDNRAIATILVGLRLFQREYEDWDVVQIADLWPAIFAVSGEGEPQPLGSEEIDELCARIQRESDMSEKGTLYLAIGDFVEVSPKDGKKFTLEELQNYVGGSIEKVPGTGRAGNPLAYRNEEGRLNDLPKNREALTKFGTDLAGDVIQVRRERAWI